MPFPWKKTRISRLVADHLQTQKRGGSLVVETGFPTSLVDLFVKNRDRLKKPSKKKRSTAHDPPIPPPPPLSPLNRPSSADLTSELSELERCSTENQIGSEIATIDFASPNVQQNVAVSGDTVVEIADGKRVLVAVLKMFFLVVLALGTKRFVVWITLSAFLLFFLEHVAKYLFRIYKPGVDSQNMLELLTQKLLRFVRIENVNVTLVGEIGCSKGEKSIVSDCPGLIEGFEMNVSSDEIKILEPPKSNFLPPIEQTQSVPVDCNERIGFEEMDAKDEMERGEDNRCESLELKYQNSRRAKMGKMRSKIKKLVPKKFRSSKKKCLDSKCVVEGSIEEDQCQEQEQQQKDAEQCELECKEFKDRSLMLPSENYCGKEKVVDAICTSSELLRGDSKANIDAICSSGELPRGDSKASEVAEELGRETVGNLRYWFICLIVLAGLVGGRILALALTLCWCLLLKSGGIPRRYIKVPMFRTCVKFYT